MGSSCSVAYGRPDVVVVCQSGVRGMSMSEEVKSISGNGTARLMFCLLHLDLMSEADGTSELGVCPAKASHVKSM